MRWLTGLRERMQALLFREHADADMDAELAVHLEMQAEANRRAGMGNEEARRQAAIMFGGVERVREEVRQARGVGIVEEWVGDTKYALRALRRSPGFTVVALLTLALGIGANSAMFSIVNGVLLRPLPYADAHELVRLYQSDLKQGELQGAMSFFDLQDFQARTRTLESMAGFVTLPTILTGQGEAAEVQMSYVTEDFFDVLGARVQQGRPLLEEDHRLAQRNVVVSERMWRTNLGGKRDVVGSTIVLRGEPYTVVGVMAESMRHPTPEVGVWMPHSLVGPNMFSNGPVTRGDHYLQGVGRLQPNVTAQQAQDELSALSAELAATYPATNADWSAAAVVPLHTSVVGDVDRALVIVLGVVGFILLIGCANLANLLLARGSARTREISVRTALGAARNRIVRQLLTESLVLAFLGAALGLALSYVGMQAIIAASADTLPRVEDIRLDGRVVAFAMVLALVTGVLFGLVPALRLSRTEPQNGLRGGRGTVGSEGRRLRNVLVVAEVALAVLLVVGAGLMARSFLELRSVETGFDPDAVLTVAMQLNMAGVPDDEMADFLVGRRELILERVRALPGVEEAGMINVFPLREDGAFSMEYKRTSGGAPVEESGVNADTRYVDPGYFGTMGIRLVRGEQLPVSWADGGNVPAVMSESAAKRLWPDEDPVGKTFEVPWGEAVLVGVVADVKQAGLAEPPPPAVYFPQLIAPRLLATLVVRTAGDPMTLAEPIRSLIREIDPNQPVRSIQPMRGVMAESIAQDRFFTMLFAVFGGLALLLAAVGIYGVLAYNVKQRTQEIGVRMAMGARAVDVLGMVAGSGMRLVGIGLVIGVAAALMLSRVLESQLYGITARDPLTFIIAIGFLAAVALLATFIPARRATRVPPMVALRPE